MSATGTRTIIWSGGEDAFCISKVGLILDLEDKCKAGIAKIFQRLINGEWSLNDVRETIRLGLIGGGRSPEEAMTLVRNNVDENPRGLAPSVLIAIEIITTSLVGVPDDPVGKQEPEAEQNPGFTTTTGASADPK